ncbi:MAG: hypothetical protein RL484_644, partial [Actinomycetota bacterium]
TDSSNLPDSSARAAHYLLGLASGGVYIATCITTCTGGLLHRRFTLTNIAIGGLLSVALFPWIAPGGRYPPPCSVKSGLSSVSCDNAVIRATLLCLMVREVN